MIKDFFTKPTINLKINVLFLLSVCAILIFTGIGIYNNYQTFLNIKKIEKTSILLLLYLL